MRGNMLGDNRPHLHDTRVFIELKAGADVLLFRQSEKEDHELRRITAGYYFIETMIEDGPSVPSECAVKVFKTMLNEFKNRDRFGKQNPRKFVRLWAEKEMHNLKRLHGGGVARPEVVLLRKHILVMSFIGRDQKRAPTLKEAMLSREQMNSAYQQCLQGMERIYRGCHLIHADLSEYNMMWFEG